MAAKDTDVPIRVYYIILIISFQYVRGARYPQLRLFRKTMCCLTRGSDTGAVYSQLSYEERRRIERWRHARVPVNEMARVLKCCRSTIFRELKRSYFSDPCMPK